MSGGHDGQYGAFSNLNPPVIYEGEAFVECVGDFRTP